MDVIERFRLDDPVIKASLMQQIPMGKMALVADIARIALFLAAPISDYMTGQSVCVNGGSFMY